jgi:hypothetical protein
VQRDPQARESQARQGRDLLARQLLELEEDEEAPVSFAHPIERGVESSLVLVLGDLARPGRALRRELVHLALDARRLKQKPALALELAPLRADHVLGDSKEPGGRVGLPLELAQPAVRDEEDLLHGVVDLDRRPPEMSGPARHPLVVERKELGQSPGGLCLATGIVPSGFWARALMGSGPFPPDLSSRGETLQVKPASSQGQQELELGKRGQRGRGRRGRREQSHLLADGPEGDANREPAAPDWSRIDAESGADEEAGLERGIQTGNGQAAALGDGEAGEQAGLQLETAPGALERKVRAGPEGEALPVGEARTQLSATAAPPTRDGPAIPSAAPRADPGAQVDPGSPGSGLVDRAERRRPELELPRAGRHRGRRGTAEGERGRVRRLRSGRLFDCRRGVERSRQRLRGQLTKPHRERRRDRLGALVAVRQPVEPPLADQRIRRIMDAHAETRGAGVGRKLELPAARIEVGVQARQALG